MINPLNLAVVILKLVRALMYISHLCCFQKPLPCEKFKDDILSCLLKETSRACPSFPTQKMYNILKEKQDDDMTEEKGTRTGLVYFHIRNLPVS